MYFPHNSVALDHGMHLDLFVAGDKPLILVHFVAAMDGETAGTRVVAVNELAVPAVATKRQTAYPM